VPAGPVRKPGTRAAMRAPPGSTMRPCQELADDREVYFKHGRSTSSGEARQWGTHGESAARRRIIAASAHVALSLRYMSARGAPRGARRVRQRMRTPKVCAFRRATPCGGIELSKTRTLECVAGMRPPVSCGGPACSIPPHKGRYGANGFHLRMTTGGTTSGDYPRVIRMTPERPILGRITTLRRRVSCGRNF
jgi:hypothetical protein